MTVTEIATLAPAGTWELDPVHSSVGFEVAYLAGTFRGRFRDAEATLTVGEGGARLAGAARVASVDVKDENLAAHLQSPEFFDAERHPELRFAAHDLSLEDGTVRVDGEITIRGATRPALVTGTLGAPMTDPYGNERIGLELSTTIDRTEFGLNWNAPLPTGKKALADDVTIVADLQLRKVA